MPGAKEIFSDFGFMALKDDKPIAAMFMFPTIGCKTCLTGWPVTSKSTTKEERDEALPLLLEYIEATAYAMGYSLMTSYPGRSSASKRFEEAGYKRGDEVVVQYYKRLGV